MVHKRQYALVLTALSLILGISTDLLVRQELFGSNFFLWTASWSVIIFVSAIYRRIMSIALRIHLALAVLSAVIVYMRSEPIVQFWSVLISIAMLGNAFARVHYPDFEKLSYTSRFAEWALGSGIAGVRYITAHVPKNVMPKNAPRISSGVLVAVPLLVVLIALFASADQVFGSGFGWVSDIVRTITDTLGSLDIGQFISIGFWTVLAFCWLALITTRRGADIRIDLLATKLFKPRDIRIIYFSIIPIFVIYSLLQIRYLFGGASLPDGLTYASYARKGFWELILVTLIASSVIYLTRRFSTSTKNATVVLPATLLVLNLFVTYTAWERLSLYESAYGWTMTRFVARLGLICITLWSASLMLWLLNKLTVKRFYAVNAYILIAVLMLAGLLNPMGLVTERNIVDRPSREVQLDLVHMLSSSPDSYPAICTHAALLKESHPDEYTALKIRQINNTDYINEPFLYKERPTTTLSAHRVYSRDFESKYHNCLQ